MALQMARNVASGGQANVLYICFEHDEQYLLNRLIAMESALAHLPHKTGAIKIQDVRKEILGTWMAEGEANAQMANNPRLRPSMDRIARYGQNLFLMRGSQTATTIDNMRKLVQGHRRLSGDRRLVVFVDYLQKVPQHPEPENETEKVTYLVNGLKDIALAEDVPMVCIVAADKEGLKASRLRNFHLRGSSAINYEADIILILNEKYHIVAKVNIEFNPYQAQRFRDWVVVSVEKNRGGQDNVDLEFEKHFEFSCFDPNGRTVQEKLIEERLYNDALRGQASAATPLARGTSVQRLGGGNERQSGSGRITRRAPDMRILVTGGNGFLGRATVAVPANGTIPPKVAGRLAPRG